MNDVKKGRYNRLIYDLSKKNEGAIEAYLLNISDSITNKNTLRNHKRYLFMFLGKINKDFDKITIIDAKKVLKSYKATSAETMKASIRGFLRFHGKNDIADNIKSNVKVLSEPTKGEESVMTPEEIQNIVTKPVDQQDRAIGEVFVITGARRGELCEMNLGDVEIGEQVIRFNLRISKTQSRKISIIPREDNPCAIFPSNLVNIVTTRISRGESRNEPLFLSRSKKRDVKGQRYSPAGINHVIKRIKLESGIPDEIKLSPHIFRHTAATYDGKTFPEQLLREKYGWKAGSKMVARYCHFNEKVLEEFQLKQAGIKPDEAKRGKICPRCGEPNNLFAEACSKCHQILDYKKLMEEVEKNKEQTVEFEKLRGDYDTLKTTMEKMQKQLADISLHRQEMVAKEVDKLKRDKTG